MWIIKENKKLFITIVAMLFLAYLWHRFFISPLNAEAENKAVELESRKSEFNEIAKNGIPDDKDVKGIEDSLSSSKDKLAILKKSLQLNIEDRFTLPKGEMNPRVYFQQLIIKEKNDIDSEAVSRNTKLPKMDNMGFSADVDEKAVPELLIKVSLISRVLRTAIASNIKSVVSISSAYSDGKASIKEGNFLNTLDVSVKVESSTESILKFIHLLQKREDFLLIKGISFKIKDSTIDTAEADLMLSGLIINEEGKSEISKSHEEAEDGGFDWQKLSEDEK